MPASYLSPKTRIGKSPINGKGLFARRRIKKGEIAAIKGGQGDGRIRPARTRRRRLPL